MVRYVATAAAALLALTAALALQHGANTQDSGPYGDATILEDHPSVELTRIPEGNRVAIAYRYSGSVSRASLVYELNGRRGVADRSDDCAKAVDGEGGVRGGSIVTEVKLDGVVPAGASSLHVVLEDETGTRILAVPFP